MVEVVCLYQKLIGKYINQTNIRKKPKTNIEKPTSNSLVRPRQVQYQSTSFFPILEKHYPILENPGVRRPDETSI